MLAAIGIVAIVGLRTVYGDGHETSELDDPPPIEKPKYRRLDSILNRLVKDIGVVGTTEIASRAPLSLGDAVAVTVRPDGDTSPIVAFLESGGATVANVGVDYVEAYVPVTLLAALSEQDGVLWVQTIIPPQPLAARPRII